MTWVFVDSSAFYALTNEREAGHSAVAKAFRADHYQLLTSNFILDETLTLTRARLGLAVAKKLGEVLRTGALVRLERVSQNDEHEAWRIFSSYSDKSFSFTDCTSFAICKRLHVTTCLTLDNDFRTFGLHCLP